MTVATIYVAGSGGNFSVPNFNNPDTIKSMVDPKAVDYITINKDGTIFVNQAHVATRDDVVDLQVYFRANHYEDGTINNNGLLLRRAIDYLYQAYGEQDYNLCGTSNGGNAIVRYIARFKPTRLHNVVTAVTPYNSTAYTRKATGFLNAVARLDLAQYVKGEVRCFASISENVKETKIFPPNVQNDGVVALNSCRCCEDIYGVQAIECYGQNHGTYMRDPRYRTAVKELLA